MKKLDEMDVTELKALCFDLNNEIAIKQEHLRQILGFLQNKIKESKTEEKDGVAKE